MKEINRYRKLKMKISLSKCDVDFLRRCLRKRITPKFVQRNIRSKLKGRNVEHVIEGARRKFMMLEIRGHYRKMELMRREMYDLKISQSAKLVLNLTLLVLLNSNPS
jgi:hypothetical protein